MDAVEVFLLMLLSTSDMLVVSNQNRHIPTLPRMAPVFLEETWLSDTSDSEATTSHKEMKRNWQKSFTRLVQFQFLSKLFLVSRTMLEVFTVSTTVEQQQKM